MRGLAAEQPREHEERELCQRIEAMSPSCEKRLEKYDALDCYASSAFHTRYRGAHPSSALQPLSMESTVGLSCANQC